MNKRYWLLEKISWEEVKELFTTDEERARIKRDGERALRFLTSAYAFAVGINLENEMRWQRK